VTVAHEVRGHDEWLAARRELLAKEKEFTRLRDELTRRRQELPWEEVEKEYSFDGPRGKQTLADLFDRRSQLVVYHFMFEPEAEEGCKHCSFWADNFDPIVVHLKARDITMVVVSRAPYTKLAAYRDRMGWSFAWVSSGESEFNYDYGVSFRPDQEGDAVFNYGTLVPGRADREGVSVFVRDQGGALFHTYSTYGRGIDLLNTAYNYIDLVPKGRGEEGHYPQYWVERHDEYQDDRPPGRVAVEAPEPR
jgi:predicted dithiol-disulfide oxidoreductase (DUF899 family)